MNREDRKRQLIAQGAVYRVELLLAKQAAEDGLRPDTLARSLLHQAAGALITAFRSGGIAGLPGMNLQTLLPLIMGGISALSKRKSLLKAIVRGTAVAGAAAGIAALVARKKNVTQQTADDATQD